jgi:hypothetical protein
MSTKYFRPDDPAIHSIFESATEGRPIFTDRSDAKFKRDSAEVTPIRITTGSPNLTTRGTTPLQFDERVEYVFMAFRAAYGSRFTSARTAQELIDFKHMWQSILMPFDVDEIKQAVQSTITTLHWPPSLIEFLEKLRAAKAGFVLPSPDQAYHEACANAASPSRSRWSHVAIYHAGRDTGWHRLRSDSSFAVSKAFAHHYERYVQRVMNGEVLPQPKASDDTPHAMTMRSQHKDATTFIQEMVAHYKDGQESGVDEVLISEVFFYLTLPQGPVRRALKKQAEDKVQQQGLPFPLPLPDVV